MRRVVVLAGGSPHAHDFEAVGRALADQLAARGDEIVLVDHPDRAARELGDGADALVVDGLWWRMLGDVYDEWRAEHGYSPSTQTRAALDSFVRDGGGLVALHTTVICFDDWPGWGELLGGFWRWGVSSHPPKGPVAAKLVCEHPVVRGLPDTIELDDEVYGDLAIEGEIEVLATSRRHADDADQPVVWVHRHGAGRVVVVGFGHDADSIRHPHLARLVGQGLDWVTEAA